MFKLKAQNGRNNICGQNLTKLRHEKGWSQRRLARELQLSGYDVDHHFIRRIENGQRFVTDMELVILSEVLQVDITNLLDFSIPIVCPDFD
ncbi:MAG: helix-turn-helix domain-containing protein [Ruminococcus sp.]|nr:helix-turn-helix domain-containing protein [Ruminococcus sp.]